MEAATTDLNAASLILATAAVLVAIMGSTLTIITLMFRQFNRHEDSDPPRTTPNPISAKPGSGLSQRSVADDAAACRTRALPAGGGAVSYLAQVVVSPARDTAVVVQFSQRAPWSLRCSPSGFPGSGSAA